MQSESKNPISKKRQETAARIIKALKENKGLLTLAAQKAGVTYWTVWKYTQDFPSVKQAVEESKESLLDFAEGKLYLAINEGNLTAIIFYLKTQGKARGYIERNEFSGVNGEPIKVDIDVKQKLVSELTRLSSAGDSAKAPITPGL